MKEFFKEFWFVIALISLAFGLSLAIPSKPSLASEAESIRHVSAYSYADPTGRSMIRLGNINKCPASILSLLADPRGWMLGQEYHLRTKVLHYVCWRRINTEVQIQYPSGDQGTIKWVDLTPLYELV